MSLFPFEIAFTFEFNPGFSRGDTPIIWPNISLKVHENERNLTEKRRATLAPLDPPMIVKPLVLRHPEQATWPAERF